MMTNGLHPNHPTQNGSRIDPITALQEGIGTSVRLCVCDDVSPPFIHVLL
jgi:hypothetical protein